MAVWRVVRIIIMMGFSMYPSELVQIYQLSHRLVSPTLDHSDKQSYSPEIDCLRHLVIAFNMHIIVDA